MEEDLCLTDSKKQACGTEQSMMEDTEDRSTQRNMKTPPNETHEIRPVYIKIPLSEMFGSESTTNRVDPNDSSRYKLIDRVPSRAEIKKRKSYIMSYNSETKNPVWVYEILNRSTLEIKCKEQRVERNECEMESNFQGHLAAPANHNWCQEAYHDTFLMSNMVPQYKSLNKDMWSKLEEYCRDIVLMDQENNVRNVHVYTGPIYSKEQKAVPTDFFKVIIVENNNGVVTEPECYLIPNKKQRSTESREAFKVSIGKIEEKSKLTFTERDAKFDIQLEKFVKWTGEDGNGELHSVDIGVRISPSNI